MATVWVYNFGGDYLIVKRTPFAYQTTGLDAYEGDVELRQGVGIPLPKWDWIRKHDKGFVFAGFSGKIYEISDLG